jgi:hypothetical protein
MRLLTWIGHIYASNASIQRGRHGLNRAGDVLVEPIAGNEGRVSRRRPARRQSSLYAATTNCLIALETILEAASTTTLRIYPPQKSECARFGWLRLQDSLADGETNKFCLVVEVQLAHGFTAMHLNCSPANP